MKIRCRVCTWTSLSACLGLSLLSGCGGSNNTPAPQASTPAATSAPTPNLAPDPAQAAASGPSSGDGYTPPGTEQPNSGEGDANSGMANSGMANSGMANSGMANSGMANSGMANSGMANSGMANSGMVNSGMPDSGGMANSGMANSGMANSGMANSGMAGMGPPSGMIAPGGMSSDYSGMTSSAGMESGGNSGMMGMAPPAGMGGMGGMGMGSMGGMNGMGGPAINDPTPPEDADYLTKGKYAFAIGKEAAAEQYVIAEMLANDTEAPNLLQQIRFSAALRKPAMTLRFGVGVNLESPSSITDYKPIGRTQFAQQNGQGMGMGSGSEGMGMMGSATATGGAAAGGVQKNFGDMTGRFGEELIKSFEGLWDAGTFGSVFADVETIVPPNRMAPGNQNNRMMEMSSGMGMSGGMTSGMAGGMSGMDAVAGGAGAAPTTGEALRLRATSGKAIVPGLTYLGTGKESELLGKAETEGLDYIFLFEVKVEMKRQRQGQSVSNDTKLRLLSVKEMTKDKRTLGSTNTLNNIKVDVAMAEKGDNDEVAKNLANLFRKVEALKMQDMPKMKPESAQARIKSLIEKKTKDVLPILMEIKLFHSQGLLNDEERDAAYQLTLPNGLAFATGSPEDRAFVLDPLLPGYK